MRGGDDPPLVEDRPGTERVAAVLQRHHPRVVAE